MDIISKVGEIPPIIDRFTIALFSIKSKVSIRRTTSKIDTRLRVYIDSTFVGRLSEGDEQIVHNHLREGKEVVSKVINAKYRHRAQIIIKLSLMDSNKAKQSCKKLKPTRCLPRTYNVTHKKRFKEISRELDWLGELGGIYRIHNSTSGKSYIGQSLNLNRRLIKEHLPLLMKGKHSNLSLQNDWIKSPSDIHFEILTNGNESECLDELEEKYVHLYNSYTHGYNKTRDGKGNMQSLEPDCIEVEFCYANRREIDIE